MVKDFLISERKIYDSIHGFIRFDVYEKELIDSLPFQRLHYIRQLGIAYHVYPGATHTRFEHSLGVMDLATKIFDKVCKTPRPDLFHAIPRKGSLDYLYWRSVLRLAALCHDLGHLPFSHVAEEDLLGLEGHEGWTAKIIESKELAPIWESFQKKPKLQGINRNFVEDIVKISLGENKYRKLKGKSLSPWEKVVSEIITGDFFGADRIDYLQRDAKCTGVAYGFFDYHQLIEMLRILPGKGKGDLCLGIDENGIESCEALLLARHFMFRRVYRYSSVKAYNFHLRQFMKTIFSAHTLEEFLSWNDASVICAFQRASKDPSHPGHEHAKRLLYRSERYRAIPLSLFSSSEHFEKFKLHCNIPNEKIAWESYPEFILSESLNFPVIRRQLSLHQASECSDLLSRIPTSKNHWAYVSADYEPALLQAIETWK